MTKTIIFIRHGEAEHNVGFEEYGEEAYSFEDYKFSNLTEKGKEQSLTLKSKLDEFNFDLIVTSPLDRCIQTTDILFTEQNRKICQEFVREINYDHPCNERRLKSELEQIYPEYNYNFSEYDIKFSKKINDTNERIETFHNYLVKNNHKTIAIISHKSFLEKYFKKHFDQEILFDNCSYHKIEF
jgi:broad specificity phosphatase PhoE